MGKETALSIVLRTVDNATAGIKRINDRIERLTAPIAGARKALEKFGELTGADRVAEGFGRVRAVLGSIVSRFALVAAAGVAAGHALLGMVGTLDDLGDTADKIGITVDRLAQLQYAAKISGASSEEMTAGLMAFNRALGQVSAGTGKLSKFLAKVSPELLRQVKAAKDPTEAFGLMADAMAKLNDPGKKAALAVAAFGGSGAALVPILSKGSAGVAELTARYAKLAGPLAKAAGVAGDIDNAEHDLAATTDGLKAAIVSGLGPELLKLITRLTEWLVQNREKISQWIEDWSKKLPDAIDKAGKAFDWIQEEVMPVWNAICGLTGALEILAALMIGKLVYAIATLSIALVTTPFGWVIAAVAAIAAGAALLILNWGKVSTFFSDLWLGIKTSFGDAWEFIKQTVDQIVGKIQEAVDFVSSKSFIKWVLGFDDVERMTAAAGGAQAAGPSIVPRVLDGSTMPQRRAQPSEAKVTVDFANAPKGTRVSTDPTSDVDLSVSVGYQMVMP